MSSNAYLEQHLSKTREKVGHDMEIAKGQYSHQIGELKAKHQNRNCQEILETKALELQTLTEAPKRHYLITGRLHIIGRIRMKEIILEEMVLMFVARCLGRRIVRTALKVLTMALRVRVRWPLLM